MSMGPDIGSTQLRIELLRRTTTLSSKGQVVIPEEIRDRLGLTPGTRFVVVAEQDFVVFKVLQAPEVDEFAGLVAQARAVARDDGLRAADVRRAVREAPTQGVRVVLDSRVVWRPGSHHQPDGLAMVRPSAVTYGSGNWNAKHCFRLVRRWTSVRRRSSSWLRP